MKEKLNTFYITTPIYYPSGNLHIGHAYTTVAGDAMARYKRMRGFDVMYLTGTDEHGQKIEQKAEEQGISPQEYVDGIVQWISRFYGRSLISPMMISSVRRRIDIKKWLRRFLSNYLDQGDIYLDEYEGWYCTPCESFFTDRQVEDGKLPGLRTSG